ncbi:hypothetical protein ACQ4LE_002950 [Meloidogyne hapla]
MESFKIENVQEGQKSNFDNNSRLSRMSLNLYTLHGIAHLVHVAWPIAQHIIWNIECSIIHGIDIDIKWKSEHGKHWLEKVLNKVRDTNMFPSKTSQNLTTILVFENDIGNESASSPIELHLQSSHLQLTKNSRKMKKWRSQKKNRVFTQTFGFGFILI